MRYFALFLVAAGLCFAAEFRTGQAARLVIGQRNFTAQDYVEPDSNTPNQTKASRELVGGVSGLAFAADTLFVVDANRVAASPQNNRVLLYKNASIQFPDPRAPFSQEGGKRCPACVGLPDVVLGQPDFEKTDIAVTQSGMRQPTAVASDGRYVAVADTNNNRVLIWNHIPTTNGEPADLVLGQPDFTKNAPGTSATTMRGPQGVWFQNGKFFVADTQNHRVLIWNSIPTQNGQAADVVLGQPDMNSGFSPTADLTLKAQSNNMQNPACVTSDGVRLYVCDLGFNRVLVWNSIPTRNQQPADYAIGQPDLTSSTPNNAKALCAPTGQDENGNDIYPPRCAATLEGPRFALSDGRRLFIADGGNDRVLVFNTIPLTSGKAADAILGQIDEKVNNVSDGAMPEWRAATDQLRTPLSLAWDGTNLYVSDPYNRRVQIYSIGDVVLPYTGVRNAASREVFAIGSITFSGEISEGDEVTIRIGPDEEDNPKTRNYTYKIVKGDTFDKVLQKLIDLINAGDGDPEVIASPNSAANAIILTARMGGPAGNDVEYGVKTSDKAKITGTTAGAKLSGGQDAARIGPGTIVTILGDDLTDQIASAPADRELPRELAGVHVYFDGMQSPILSVSPTQIIAQLPYEMYDTTNVSAVVRAVRSDGRVTVTNAAAVPIVKQNPGIFAEEGEDPRPGLVYHYSSFATGTISVDGTANAGDVATVTIEDRKYSYTVQQGDTLETIRDNLIALINNDPKVEAYGAGMFTRIRLRARIPGPAGNGIKIGGSANEGGQVIITATNSELCCANIAGSRVTPENPALPGETVVVYATGLGLVKPTEIQQNYVITGAPYQGPYYNEPNEFVSSLAGGKTANVLYSGLKQGAVGIYEVHLELNADLPTNPRTQMTIAQDVFVSNIVTFPVVNPNPSSSSP